jgi:hypothetical protein
MTSWPCQYETYVAILATASTATAVEIRIARSAEAAFVTPVITAQTIWSKRQAAGWLRVFWYIQWPTKNAAAAPASGSSPHQLA